MKERETGFWCLASGLFGGIALLKGLRAPGVWAMSQLQITYFQGFVKRGLTGQLLYLLHIRSKHAVQAFCAAELLCLAGLLAVFTWKCGLLSKDGQPILVAAFAGSYAVTFLAHLIGYQDISLYALVVAVLLIRHPRTRFLVAIPACIVALLIHENFLVTALPALLFSFVVDRESDRSEIPTIYACALLTIAILVTVSISLKSSLSPQALETFKQATVARAAYPVDASVLGVLGFSAAENLRLNSEVISQNWWWWAELGVAVLSIGPLLALMMHRASKTTHGLLKAAFFAASLAPLLLNIIGWDNVRWVSLCALTTYINLGLLNRSCVTEGRASVSLREQQAAILVLGLGLASGYGLMDGKKVNPYPFFPPTIRPAALRHDGVGAQIL